MENLIKNELKRYFRESKENWFEEINDTYYEEPIIKFADTEDPLFQEYKKIIGEHHFTPREAFELSFGEGSYKGGTVRLINITKVIICLESEVRNCGKGL